MGTLIWHDMPLRCLPHHSVHSSKQNLQALQLHLCRPCYTSPRKCKSPGIAGDFDVRKFVTFVGKGDSNKLTDAPYGGDETALLSTDKQLGHSDDELVSVKLALSDAKARQEALEKERDKLIEKLAFLEAKQEEYAAAMCVKQEAAVAEFEAAKAMFNQKLEKSLEEKFALESTLVHAKQDAVQLALQVEKLAEVALQQATSNILDDAQLRVSAAEASAVEAQLDVEEQVRNAVEGAVSPILKQLDDKLIQVLSVTEKTSASANDAVTTMCDEMHEMDEIASLQSLSLGLKNAVRDLESQLVIKHNEIENLKSVLKVTEETLTAAEVRARKAQEALTYLQESFKRQSAELEKEIKDMFENVNKEVARREEVLTSTFKSESQSFVSSLEAAKTVNSMKDEAYTRRCAALERSLKASEAAKKVWRQRAEFAESFLSEGRLLEAEELATSTDGGRIDLLTDDDSKKWKLLAEGPRRDIPEYMARRIKSIFPRFPPRKPNMDEALIGRFPALSLPNVEEVWSIAQEQPQKDDILIKHVVEKEDIEKHRRALERALHQKEMNRQRVPEQRKSEPGTGTGREIVFQGFNWESWRRQWYQDLAAKAADLSQCGVTAIWLPPPTQSVAPQGYMPVDLYNLNSAYGTLQELKSCIEEIHAHNILALGDVVLNHRCAQKQSPNGVWNIFGGKLAWGPEAIVCDDPNFHGRGNPSSGDIFHAAPNIDHSQEFVRKDIKEWLNWLRSDIGFDGWRLDFVRGFSGVFVKEYIEASNPAFSIGEYWDSLAYEGGNLCYNQDVHRQRIVNWINETGGTSSAFDITTKGILHSALHGQYWRLIDPQGKPPGVMGWWPSRAVTFLENHDTGSTQGHWPFPREKLAQGYAYILTQPGTPVIFYDHFYDFGLREIIMELLEVRKRAGIHCRSSIKIFHANNDGYVAHVGDNLVMKLGHFSWNPSKENQLDGSWQKFVDRGSDYQVWLRQ